VLEIGATFDRYTIEATLGEGGMGKVYRALDTRLHRRVALKLLRPERMGEPSSSGGVPSGALDLLLREARAAAALEHPNAVAIFDVGEVGGVAYMAMELIEGRSMRALIADAGVPWAARLGWLLGVAKALAAAHDRGLVHRDVKPENIMVRSDGVVKVLDFGIARHRRPRPVVEVATAPTLERGLATLSGAGNLVGTPCYMAPEQMRGEAVDGRIDQFAWGVVAYEAITGALPWDATGDPLKLVAEILSKDPAPPSLRASGLSSHLEAVVLKAMAKVPAHRFATMHEVARELEPHVSTMPIAAASSSGRPLAAVEGVSARDTQISTKGGLARVGPMHARSASRRRRARALFVVPVLAVGVVLGLAIGRHGGGRPPRVQVDAAPPAPATAITDLPLPRSAVPAALAAYKEALVGFQDGSTERTFAALRKASELDPSLGAPRLRLGLVMFWRGQSTEAREELHQAALLRDTLDERDRTLLDAHQPLLVDRKADSAEAARRMAEAVHRFPNDVEIRLYYGSMLLERGEMGDAIIQLRRSTELDPRFVVAWLILGQARAQRGELDEALGVWETCATLASSGIACRDYRAKVFAQRGECAAVEQEARQMKASDPSSPLGYRELARALAATGHPVDAIQDELARAWSRVSPETRDVVQLSDRVKMDTLAGDFVEAEHYARELEQRVADEAGMSGHARAAYSLAQVELEMGHDADAARTAQGYFDRLPTWMSEAVLDDTSILPDPTPLMAAILLHTGHSTAAEAESRRDAWLAQTSASAPPFFQRYMWFPAYALPARSADEAALALSVLEAYEPLPAKQFYSMPEALAGKVYLLANKPAEALPRLERGANVCSALDEPILQTQAQQDLGVAREAAGNKPGACAAYRVVLARWGDARPRSVTAEKARARVKALGCGPT